MVMAAVAPDLANNPISLEIYLKSVSDQKPIPNVKVTIYKVADMMVVGDGFYFKLTSEFSGTGVDVNNIDTAAVNLTDAADMLAYAGANGIAGISQTTDQYGKALFDVGSPAGFAGITPGIYLVCSDDIPGYNDNGPIQEFLVAVPNKDADGKWVYRLTASPKADPSPVVTPMPSTPPPSPSTPPPSVSPSTPPPSISPSTVPPSHIPPSYIPPSYVPPSYIPPSYIPPSYAPPASTPPTIPPPASYPPRPSYAPPSGTATPQGTAAPPSGTASPAAASSGTPTPYYTVPPGGPNGSGGGNLPQTGMLNWPIPILSSTGLVFFSVGWIMLKNRKKNDEDGDALDE